jgi:DNA-directed RNA polymerase subunit RPC12/RpoP
LTNRLRFATLLVKSNIGGATMAQAYCMKCRKKVEIKNPRSVTLKNKRPATQGVCPNCGTKVFRIGKG